MTPQQKKFAQAQRENLKLTRENARIQAESNKRYREERAWELRNRAKSDALCQAAGFDYAKKTSEAVLKEANKLYQWLIKDLK